MHIYLESLYIPIVLTSTGDENMGSSERQLLLFLDYIYSYSTQSDGRRLAVTVSKCGSQTLGTDRVTQTVGQKNTQKKHA